MTFDLQSVYKAVLHHCVTFILQMGTLGAQREASGLPKATQSIKGPGEDPASLLDSKACVVRSCGTTAAFSRTEENLAILSLWLDWSNLSRKVFRQRPHHGVHLRTSRLLPLGRKEMKDAFLQGPHSACPVGSMGGHSGL